MKKSYEDLTEEEKERLREYNSMRIRPQSEDDKISIAVASFLIIFCLGASLFIFFVGGVYNDLVEGGGENMTQKILFALFPLIFVFAALCFGIPALKRHIKNDYPEENILEESAPENKTENEVESQYYDEIKPIVKTEEKNKKKGHWDDLK